ncbi:hypothetical protein [Niabella hirudinis]|uniref:hypothetical protein n=1 Tax=Niabella hirudinis TaxID=1285929 RepID=UPI003EC0FCDF
MRKKYLLLLFIFSSAIFVRKALAQSPQIIKIDFNKKTVDPPTKDQLRKAEKVQIQIVNLPVNAYTISINKKDSMISAGATPEMFSILNYGSSFAGLLGGLSGSLVRTVDEKIIREQAALSALMQIFAHQGIPNDDQIQMLLELKQREDKTPENRDKKIGKTIEKMRDSLFNFHFKFRDNVIKRADRLLYLVDTGGIDQKNFEVEAQAIIAKRLALEKDLEIQYLHYYNTVLPQYAKIRSDIGLSSGDSMLTAYKKNFSQFLAQFDSSFNESLIAKIYNQLAPKPATTDFLSLPYLLKTDISKFEIDITGKDPAKALQNYSTVIELNKRPNLLWSFTTGLYLSGLRSTNYSIYTNVTDKGDTTGYNIREEKNNNMGVGLAALLHYGYYFSEASNLGVFASFGPGLSFENTPRPRILIGAGLMIGKNNKLAISGGWIGGSVKEISASYNLKANYNPAPKDLLADKFKGSWYFSLGYSLWGN